MAQSGYTPILIYGSGTASNIPSAANLTSSANGAELALNYADGKLYYKSSAGTVTLLSDQNAVTVATANGFGGTIAKATATTTPAITIRTSVTGVLVGNGTAVAAAVSGTDFKTINSTSILGSGNISITSTPGGSTTQVQYNNAGAFGGSANFVWDNSNVRLGIGTSSPVDRLTVENTSTAVDISVIGPSSSQAGIRFGYTGATYQGRVLYDNASNYMAFNTNGSERMRITSAGNVGIGTSSPGYRLTVESNTLIYTDSVSSNNYSLTNGGTNYGGGVAPYLTVAGAGGSYGYLLIKGGNGGTSNTANIGLANKNSAGNYILGALIGCGVTTATAGSETQHIAISTQNGGGAIAERVRISGPGGFSVGTTADPGAGAIYATGAITAFYSDRRLKDVKGTIANALDKVASLSGVYYTNNEVAVAHGYTSAETQVGLLAQDVEAVLPEVVKAAPFDLDEKGNSKSGEHYKTIQYERVIPLLVEAIKELRAEIQTLRG